MILILILICILIILLRKNIEKFTVTILRPYPTPDQLQYNIDNTTRYNEFLNSDTKKHIYERLKNREIQNIQRNEQSKQKFKRQKAGIFFNQDDFPEYIKYLKSIETELQKESDNNFYDKIECNKHLNKKIPFVVKSVLDKIPTKELLLKNDECVNKAIYICKTPIKTSEEFTRRNFPEKQYIKPWKDISIPTYTSIDCYNKVYNCCKQRFNSK